MPARDDAPADRGDAPAEPAAAMAAALAEIRREGYKAAGLTAAVDATLALLVANAALTLAGVTETVVLPLDRVGGPPVAVRARTLAAVAVGGVVLVAGVAWRVRRPLVEQYEAGNPEVREALRTARDAVGRDDASPVAHALYDDVLDALAGTSSAAFLDRRRLAAALGLVAVVSVATLHASLAGVVVLDVTPGGPGSAAGAGASHGQQDDRRTTTATGALRDGESVLGEPTDVTAGGRNLTATVSAAGAGSGSGDRDRPASQQGLPGGDVAVDAQRAGYRAPDPVEDAALVRAYASRIQGGNESV